MKKVVAILSSLLLLGAGCLNGSVLTDVQVAPPRAVPEITIEADADANAIIDAEAEADADVSADAGAEVDITLAETVEMQTGSYYFQPNTISATPGQTVNVKILSTSGFHTFVINGVTKQTIKPDGTITFTAPTTPGEYPFYCDVGNHRTSGMEGTLFVE